MVDIIGLQLKEWNSSPDENAPRVVIMSGTGGKSFCAGGDVASLYNSHIGKEGSDPNLKTKFLA